MGRSAARDIVCILGAVRVLHHRLDPLPFGPPRPVAVHAGTRRAPDPQGRGLATPAPRVASPRAACSACVSARKSSRSSSSREPGWYRRLATNRRPPRVARTARALLTRALTRYLAGALRGGLRPTGTPFLIGRAVYAPQRHQAEQAPQHRAATGAPSGGVHGGGPSARRQTDGVGRDPVRGFAPTARGRSLVVRRQVQRDRQPMTDRSCCGAPTLPSPARPDAHVAFSPADLRSRARRRSPQEAPDRPRRPRRHGRSPPSGRSHVRLPTILPVPAGASRSPGPRGHRSPRPQARGR